MASNQDRVDGSNKVHYDNTAKGIVIFWLFVVAVCIGAFAYFLLDSIINKVDSNLVTKLNCSCGIMNGDLSPDRTQPNQFPWQVGFLQTISQRIMCGGALLSDLYVITSASCMKTSLLQSDSEREYYFKIVLGEHDVGAKGQTQWFSSRRIIVYPDYNNETGENDFAIIVLSTNATMNDVVSNLCLPDRFGRPFLPLPRTGITSGWSTLQHQLNETLILGHEEVEISENCLSQMDLKRNSSKICGRSKIKDCRGDLGGPLVGKLGDEDHYTLLGIASKVDANCEYITFSMITQKFLKWSRMILLGTSLCIPGLDVSSQ